LSEIGWPISNEPFLSRSRVCYESSRSDRGTGDVGLAKLGLVSVCFITGAFVGVAGFERAGSKKESDSDSTTSNTGLACF